VGTRNCADSHVIESGRGLRSAVLSLFFQVGRNG